MACYQDALEKIVLALTGLEARQNKIWKSGTYANRYVARHAPCGSGHISENVRLQDVVANSHISDWAWQMPRLGVRNGLLYADPGPDPAHAQPSRFAQLLFRSR